MKVCTYNGIRIVVLIRDEHCPPHVHAGGDGWKTTFEFSFWHDSVKLGEVKGTSPKTSVLETLRRVVEQPQNLRKARELWWQAVSTVCLTNKYWDSANEEVIDGKLAVNDMPTVESASFDQSRYSTVLKLSDDEDPLEIML
jgi:hypothetical protein